MARPLRIEYPGAWYHVMNRGARRRRVFETDDQRRYFLSLLAETSARFNAEWHAYCLMADHYHLLVHTPEGNLQRIMRHLNGVYTQHFNLTQGHDGPLFRGRYKAILVDADSYWLQLSGYIHRNPLRARVVADLSEYRWSSYRAYIGLDKPPVWLTTQYILQTIGQHRVHQSYQAYVLGDTDTAFNALYATAATSPILGDASFKATVLAGKTPSIDVPELRAQRISPTLSDIVDATCRHFGVDEQTLWRSTRGKGAILPARAVTMYLCQRVADLRLREIAEIFGLASYASAGATIRTVRQRMKENHAFADQIESIILDLTP